MLKEAIEKIESLKKTKQIAVENFAIRGSKALTNQTLNEIKGINETLEILYGIYLQDN